jgi:hypothetical protein
MKKQIKQIIIATILTVAMIFNSFSILAADSLPLALTSATGVVGGYVNIYLTMGANSGLGGGSFTVTYDPLKLEPAYAAADPAPGAQSIIADQAAIVDPNTEAPIGGSSTLLANITTPGTILVSVINTVGFIPGGNLFKLRFKLLAGAAGDMPVNVTVNTFTAASLGNPAIPYTITSQGVISGPTPSPTPTPDPAVSVTPTPEPTNTPMPTSTPTPMPTSTPTPMPTSTPTPMPTSTPTPMPTSTPTPMPTATPTPRPTNTPAPTVAPTATTAPTAVPSQGVTPTITNNPEVTMTPTVAPTSTTAPTATPGSATTDPDEEDDNAETSDASNNVMLVVLLMSLAATVLAVRKRRYN